MGGFSSSGDVVDLAAVTSTPILAQYDTSSLVAGGDNLMWSKQVVSSTVTSIIRPLRFNFCKYSLDYTRIVALTMNPHYAIYIYQASSGTLLKALYES